MYCPLWIKQQINPVTNVISRVKPAYNGIARHQMFLRCRLVPFHACNWRLVSQVCKGFPLKTGFHWTQVPFKTDFSAFCWFQGCYWGLVYSVYEIWFYRHGGYGGFIFLHFAPNGDKRTQRYQQYEHGSTFLTDHTASHQRKLKCSCLLLQEL